MDVKKMMMMFATRMTFCYNLLCDEDTSLDAESSNNHNNWSRDSAAAAVKFAGDEANPYSIEEVAAYFSRFRW